MMDFRKIIGKHDILFVTLDTLRFDVAEKVLREGLTPGLQKILPDNRWEKRHTPGSFTYAAHQAFFAGFLPTPVAPGIHARIFASDFTGSETTDEKTFVFKEATIVEALKLRGYQTICIGGVGFFNKQTALGKVLPNLFEQSYWTSAFGVTDRNSTENQVAWASKIIEKTDNSRRLFIFINISAIHQPNCIFTENIKEDSPETQAAALSYVDQHLPLLIDIMRKRAPIFCIICSDHGTAYGEEGYHGHRSAHPAIWTVPYAHFELSKRD